MRLNRYGRHLFILTSLFIQKVMDDGPIHTVVSYVGIMVKYMDMQKV